MGKYKLDLQLFAAPDGMTGQGNLEVKAREIDFVTSFGKNIQALLDVLGIARMIRKENGSALKTKEVAGELKSGDIERRRNPIFSVQSNRKGIRYD